MRKLITLCMLLGAITFTNAFAANATVGSEENTKTLILDENIGSEDLAMLAPNVLEAAQDDMADGDKRSFQQIVKDKFIEGGWEFMSFVLVCLILGLAIAIERIITLNLASTNTTKLIAKVEEALQQGGVDAATEVCKATRGPIASIFTQGLMRISEGIEMVEKSIISYGSVEMGKLEKGLVWISLFISLAPMLGFMGTVIGMIDAFDAIQAAGDISPSLVAKGIKVALLTTVAGLIVAIILQLFYNYCVSKVDSLVNQMEDASISLVDVLIKHKLTNK